MDWIPWGLRRRSGRGRLPAFVLGALLGIVLAALFATAARAQSTIVVTTTNDAAPAAGECNPLTGSQCSLRQAIDKAASGDTIQLGETAAPPATYSVTLGQLTVAAKTLSIIGNGVGETTIDGTGNSSANGPSRIMKITGQATATIQGVTFTGGTDNNDEAFKGCSPCETISGNGGGAIFADATSTLNLMNVDFKGNSGSATPVGGGLASGGSLAMNNVSFEDNGAGFGGGLFVRSGEASGNAVTFLGNSDAAGGGGVFVDGGTLVLANSTFSGNGSASGRGGGLENHAGTVDLGSDSFAGDLRGSIQTDAGHNATTSVGNTIIGSGFSDGVDYGCVSAGQNDGFGEYPYYEYTAAPITTDLGHNLDQDDACGLTDTSDLVGVDPILAPIADNGGPVQTEALLAGSPAIDAADDGTCPKVDARGVARPQGAHCDIGAFEAVTNGQPPTASTDAAGNVTSTDALLSADINLQGEPGGYYFEWGLSAGQMTNQTPVQAAGVVSQTTTVSQDLPNLSPGQTYYVRAVAANGTHQTVAENIQHFTTPPQAPAITNLDTDTPTATSVTVIGTVDPSGADTTYTVAWGTDPENLDHSTASTLIPASNGPQDIEQALSGLTPGTTYFYEIDSTNSVGTTSSTPPEEQPAQFTTASQITGTEGQEVSGDDLFDGRYYCPNDGSFLTIDWGDGTSDSNGQVTCGSSSGDQLTFTVSDAHTYRTAGLYTITANGGEAGVQTTYAQIADAPLKAAGVDGSATAGSAFDGPVATFTDANPLAQAGDFTAMIDWGDGSSPTTGTVAAAPAGGFQVSGSHTYATAGASAVTVTIDDVGGSTAVATSAVQVTQAQQLPAISQATVSRITDTAATVSASIDPYGLDTRYTVSWGTSPTNLSHTLPSVDVGSGTTAQDVQQSLSGLSPGTTYYYEIDATSQAGTASTTTTDRPLSFQTAQLLSGVEGTAVSGDDLASGLADGCPTATVDWGDGSTGPGSVTCGPSGPYTVAGSHVYAAAGRYTITVTPSLGGPRTLYAQIADAPLKAVGVDGSATAGSAFDGPVATFTDANPLAQAGDFTAMIDWGDGSSPTSGTVVAAPGGGFQVSGSHTFTTAGAPSVTVGIDDVGGSKAVAISAVQVTQPTQPPAEALSLSPVSAIAASAGKTFSGVVATFTDSNPAAVPSDFTATIDWGDGTPPTTGTVGVLTGHVRHAAGDPAFQVTGTHTYATGGAKTVAVSVADTRGQRGSVQSPMSVTAPPVGGSSPPTNVTPPQITGTTSAGSRLTATPGTWTGSPTSFQYRWLSCAADGTRCSGTGATGSSYRMRARDVGHTLEVQVTAANAVGSSPAAPSATTAVVLPHGLPLPVAGHSADMGVVSGTVLIRLPGHRRFTRLRAFKRIPLGAVVDATHGRVTITVRGPGGKLISADFYSGKFVVSQPRGSRYTVLRLVGSLAACHAPRHTINAGVARRRPARPRGHQVRHLWGSGHGAFQTVGKSASASVQGTIWLTADYCNGTLVRVRRGIILVRDFVHHKKVKITAGHSYFS